MLWVGAPTSAATTTARRTRTTVTTVATTKPDNLKVYEFLLSLLLPAEKLGL